MNFYRSKIPDVIIFEPTVFGDERGYFVETFRDDIFEQAVGCRVKFIQDNESKSGYGVLRGLHFQIPPLAQSKLVRVIEGKVMDVAVDIRTKSPTFGQSVAFELSSENKRQVFIPKGFAHGFLVLSENAIFTYKVDNYYSPKHDRGIAYDDPALKIDWLIDSSNLLLSEKDRNNPLLKDAQFLFD